MNDFKLCDVSLDDIEKRAVVSRAKGIQTLIGGLVYAPDGRLFAQRRSLTRRFGPGLWDNVGGHVEDNETLHATLAREIVEETGWRLTEILKCIAIRSWQDDRGPSEEYIVTCRVAGDLYRPSLEEGKVDKTAWIGSDNLDLLNENRSGDTSQSQIYAHALKYLHV